jgi:hypothetical protein
MTNETEKRLTLGDLTPPEQYAAIEGEAFGQALNLFLQSQAQAAMSSLESQGVEVTAEREVAISQLAHNFLRAVATSLCEFGDALVAEGAFPILATARPWKDDRAGIRVLNADASVLFDGARPENGNTTTVNSDRVLDTLPV